MRVYGVRSKFFLSCLLLLPLSMLAVGCSSEGSVSGKVYYKGKLVTRGTVQFFPEAKGGNYASMIESDGSYSIPKVPPGQAKISVVVGMKGPPPNLFDKMGRGKEAAAKGLEKQRARAKAEGAQTEHAAEDAEVANAPQKYTNPDESGLSLDVTGGKQTYDIKLE